jgi:hypothetical protein
MIVNVRNAQYDVVKKCSIKEDSYHEDWHNAYKSYDKFIFD